MSLLTINNVSARFQHAPENVLKHISLNIKEGEILGIVGESGSGKSVTAQTIMRLLSPHLLSYSQGEVVFRGEDLLKKTESDMRSLRGKDISMVFQDPMSALNPLHTIEKQLKESIILHQNVSKDKLQQRMLELLDEVELSKLKDRLHAYPHQLSGGERQRVMIAMAIANHPKLLIADEPTTALDVHVQEQIILLLQNLRVKYNMAIMFISHDLLLIKRIANTTLVMQRGEIVEQGRTEEVFKNPQHAYTKKLLASQPSGVPIPLKERSSEILRLNDISVSFITSRTWLGKPKEVTHALHNISLSLREGETIGIVGESGSGKTTLAQTILKLIPCTGQLLFNHKDMNTLSSRELLGFRRDIQCVFQDPFASLNPRLTIGFIISEGLRIHHPELTESAIEHRVLTIMNDVGLTKDMIYRYPHEFSGGQRQRISIARAMILKPKLLILDEPTSALDVSLQARILTLLRELQQKTNTSYVFISHDLRVIRALAHQIIVLRSGRIIEHGEAETIFKNPQSDYTQTLLKAAFVNENR